jgi:hypothetical protein
MSEETGDPFGAHDVEFWRDELDAINAAGKQMKAHRDALLKCLQVDGKCRDAEAAWRAISGVARSYPKECDNPDPLAVTVLSRARIASRKVTHAIDALAALVDVLERDESRRFFEYALRETDSIVHASTQERLQKLRSDLNCLLETRHAASGHPLPAQCIHTLAAIYEKWTGKRYTVSAHANGGASSFVKFVHAFSEATGRGRALGTVANDIKSVRPTHAG